jgi:hypothetical protein
VATSNDSRLRAYAGVSLACKFKGARNRLTQIRADVSDDGSLLLTGSDVGAVYAWELGVGNGGGN